MDNESESFFSAVYRYLKSIPKGKVTTYGAIAKAIGRPRSSRIVGYALHCNPSPETIPCYKVLNRFGELAPSFAFGGQEVQAMLLKSEGIEVIDGKVDLKRYFYDEDQN